MGKLDTIKDWLRSWSDFSEVSNWSIDYTDAVPLAAGILPSGIQEISRTTDILGNTTVTNQLNIALHTVVAKSPSDYEGSAELADITLRLQEWVQAQSIRHKVPILGDIPENESATAQNGTLFSTDIEGVGIYVVQLAFTYQLYFPSENPWMV